MRINIGPSNEDRTQEFEHNNVKFLFKASDPYGFIKITCLTINSNLPGQFTSLHDAKKTAITFANNYTPKTKKRS